MCIPENRNGFLASQGSFPPCSSRSSGCKQSRRALGSGKSSVSGRFSSEPRLTTPVICISDHECMIETKNRLAFFGFLGLYDNDLRPKCLWVEHSVPLVQASSQKYQSDHLSLHVPCPCTQFFGHPTSWRTPMKYALFLIGYLQIHGRNMKRNILVSNELGCSLDFAIGYIFQNQSHGKGVTIQRSCWIVF